MKNTKTFKVVMIDTEKETTLHFDNTVYHKLIKTVINIVRPYSIGQHLYILSDDAIKEGDWFLSKDGKIDKLKGFNFNVRDDKKYLYKDTIKECYNIHGDKYILFPESFVGKIISSTDK